MAGIIAFGAAQCIVAKHDGSADITILRSGDLSGTVRVDYIAVKDATDYATKLGRVTFAHGESKKIVTIPTSNDTLRNGNVSFAFRIVAVCGGTLGFPTTTRVIVQDVEAPSGDSEPDDPQLLRPVDTRWPTPRHSGNVYSALRTAKRALDLAGSIVLIFVFTPLMILIAALLKVSERGPVLFVQIRVGKDGKRFKCLKFRTMVVDAEEALKTHLSQCPGALSEWSKTQKLRDDPRLTALGRFLRKTSLDELPQLFNILAGQMSFVGPRPIVEEEIPRYGHQIVAYMTMKPGLTGLWQISGRSNLTYEERVALDARYVSEWTLRTDIMILLRTIPAVLRQDGSC